MSPPQSSPGSIPDSPVAGKIRGAPFKVADARYYVDQRRGYEHIDIELHASDAKDACGELAAKDQPTVWLRRKGAEPLAPGEVRVGTKSQGPWEVHYQARDKHRWVGNGDAGALFVIREVRRDGALVGDLSVCFADAEKSCVSGAFTARSCPIRIDAPVRGTEIRGESPDAYLRRLGSPPVPASASAAPTSSASAAPAPEQGRSPR